MISESRNSFDKTKFVRECKGGPSQPQGSIFRSQRQERVEIQQHNLTGQGEHIRNFSFPNGTLQANGQMQKWINVEFQYQEFLLSELPVPLSFQSIHIIPKGYSCQRLHSPLGQLISGSVYAPLAWTWKTSWEGCYLREIDDQWSQYFPIKQPNKRALCGNLALPYLFSGKFS